MNTKQRRIRQERLAAKQSKSDSIVYAKSDWSKTGYNQFDKVLHASVEQAYKKQKLRKDIINGFRYVDGLSTEHIAVFQNLSNKEVIVAIKGTSTKKETLLDLKLMLQTSKTIDRNQLVREKSQFDKIKSSYPNSRIFLTGHSLGGIKVFYILKQMNQHIEGTVFNMYVPITLSAELMDLYKQNTNVKIVHVKGDPLSDSILKYRRDVVVLNPPLHKRNIMAHLMDTVKRF